MGLLVFDISPVIIWHYWILASKTLAIIVKYGIAASTNNGNFTKYGISTNYDNTPKYSISTKYGNSTKYGIAIKCGISTKYGIAIKNMVYSPPVVGILYFLDGHVFPDTVYEDRRDAGAYHAPANSPGPHW